MARGGARGFQRNRERRCKVNLTEAKERLTIHMLWRHFRFESEPSKSCRCPLHDDRSASFSTDGTLWNCFAGCGGGDSVDFYALATGLPHSEACRGFIALAGGSAVSSVPRPPRPASADVDKAKADQRRNWPLFESPVTGEDDTPARAMGALARLRHVSADAVTLMAARGLLWFAAWKDSPSWIVTDSARLNSQARRMDGKPWPGIGAKAQTLPGSRAAWPVGAREAQPFRVVLLCEGGPDLLAAHHFIHAHGRQADTAAVAMLGAGMNIHPADLALFTGKTIRIMTHTDEPGRAAEVRWTEQLETVRATVDAVSFYGLVMEDGSPIEDLNDCTRIATNQTNELSNLIPANENQNI